MSDSREIDHEDQFPPLGSPLWRLRMDEGAREIARVRAETDATFRKIVTAVEQIFKEPPF